MITFANATTYETVRIMGGMETFQGQQRKTLAIDVAADLIALDEAKALYKDAAALSELTVETAGETSVQLNFTLPVELKVHELTTGENGETTEVVTIKVAQKSSLEIAQEQQAQDIEDANAALCELAEIVAGGVDNG